MADNADASASGFVPGGGGDSCVWRSMLVCVGLDRMSVIFSEVLSVKVKDCVVISYFLRVLSIIVHPPPN
jgi:hypothetical protein